MVQRDLNGKDVPEDSEPGTHGYLELVGNRGMLDKVEAVLFNPAPSHYDRVWLVNYFKYVGYDNDQICGIIHVLNEWDGYSAQITYVQVSSIRRSTK
jgi:hypothetical protein